MVTLSDIEAEVANNVQMYGHSITRGGAKVTIIPSPSPVVWVPQAPAVGGSTPSPGFSADTLGVFLPSHDSTGGVPKYSGMVRGMFEVKSKANGSPTGSSPVSAYSLEPGAPPGMSPLWIALLKKVEVPSNSFVCVGSKVLG